MVAHRTAGPSTTTAPLRPLQRALVALELLLAVGAFGGAIGLVTGTLDLHEAADDLPLASPVLGGIALALCNGVLPLVVAGGTLRRAPWASWGHLAVGGALIGWIVVQVAFIGFGSALQAAYLAYGVLVLVLGAVDRRAVAAPG